MTNIRITRKNLFSYNKKLLPFLDKRKFVMNLIIRIMITKNWVYLF